MCAHTLQEGQLSTWLDNDILWVWSCGVNFISKIILILPSPIPFSTLMDHTKLVKIKYGDIIHHVLLDDLEVRHNVIGYSGYV